MIFNWFDSSGRGNGALKTRKRVRPRQSTRWRPNVEFLEQHVLMTLGADLVVSTAVAPTLLTASQNASVSYTVTNRGDGNANASWTDSIYLSKDSTLDVADSLLNTTPAPSNLAGHGSAGYDSYTSDVSFVVPSSIASGDYYLLYTTNSGLHDQTESNESNNVRAVPVTVANSGSTQLPDLVITDATAPRSAVVGNIELSWTVKNQGTGPVPGYWVDAVYLSKTDTYDPLTAIQVAGEYNPGPLAVGASATSTYTAPLPASVPAGDYYLLFLTDYNGGVGESNETNNVRALPMTLSVPNVDLAVTKADAPSTATSGGSITVSWTVKNQGTDPASANWSDTVYLSTDGTLGLDTYVGSYYRYTATPLAGGESYSQTLDVNLPGVAAGSYYLLFSTDNWKAQTETNETNNVIALPITISARNIDLALTAASAPVTAAPGQIAVSWTVKNKGTDSIQSFWTDGVYLSKDQTYDYNDAYLVSGYDYGLDAGKSYTTDQSVNLPNSIPGDYYLLFRTDIYNVQKETDETNNLLAVPITLTAATADLMVTGADVPSTVTAEASTTLSWTVKNQGTGPASAGWYDLVYLSTDATLDSAIYVGSSFHHAEPSLAAGASYTLTSSMTIPDVPTGSYYLLVVADGYQYQAESNETNNILAKPIAVTATTPTSKVDLAMSDAQAPASAQADQFLSSSWIVTNAGIAPASSYWTDAVYLSTDGVLDTTGDPLLVSIDLSSQSPLAIGRSYIVSTDVLIPASTAAGDYHLFLVANSRLDQLESSETNNVADLSLTVQGKTLIPPKVSAFMVNDGSAQRSMVTSLTLAFSGIVTIDNGAFQLTRADGTAVGLKVSTQELGGKTLATLTFEGVDVVASSLADGKYTLTLASDKVHDSDGQTLDGLGDGSSGSDYVNQVFRLFGDTDGDGDVDNKDYFAFRTTAGKSLGDPNYLWYLDSNGDGTVDLATDFAAFKVQNRKTLA